MQQLLRAVAGNPQAMDGFFRMNAGTISPARFFSPENVRAILAGVPHLQPGPAGARPSS
jgi:hypothetical protein